MTVQERDAGPDGDADTVVENHKVERTPLPKLQLAIVFLIQFAEPVTATVIYPFINQFVRETGITGGDETKTGYYAGIVESLFFFTETATVFGWGWLSDVLGRKPVLLLGPLGLSLSMLGFGLSTTYWPLFYFRASQGLFNGNIGVSKSIMAEITDETNIGDAYALAPLNWALGVTLGPMMGGVLSNAADHWPETWGKSKFIRVHPYFLPCAAAAFIAFLSFVISSIALKETLPRNALRNSWGRLSKKLKPSSKDNSATALLSETDPVTYGAAASLETAVPLPTEQPRPPMSQLLVPTYLYTVLNYGIFAFVDMSMSALIPLVYSTPIEYGGLGMAPFQIGTIMAVVGMTTGILSALFLGPVLRRYGPNRIFKLGLYSFFVTFSALPMANMFARRAGEIDWRVIAMIVVQFSASTLFSPCYASMGILVVQNAPSKQLLGAANGAAQMITSGSRALAPAIASSLFSISISRNLLGGHMVYYIFLTLSVGLIFVSQLLPTPTGRG